MGSEELAPWGKIQKRTFTRWCNIHLIERKLKIDDLETDFEDGYKLLNLLEIISGKKIQYNKNVKFYSQKLENVGKALKFVREQGIKLVAIGPEDLVEKRIKLILGLIWTIILRYQINKVEYTVPESSLPSVNVVQNQDLLQWVNSVVPEFRVKNFKSDWKDGRVIYALVNVVKPGILDAAASVNLLPVERAAAAIEAAKVTLQIPQLIDANDMVSDQSDDLSVMTYVSYFRAYDAKAKLVDPANTQVFGVGIKKAKVGEENAFSVITRNAFNDQIKTGGASLNIKISPQDDPAVVVPAIIKDNHNGQYDIRYNPTTPGKHLAEVLLDGVPTQKSPFIVVAKEVPGVVPSNSGVTREIYVGPDGLTHFEVTTRDKSGNPLLDSSVPLVATVTSISDGSEAHVTVTPTLKEDGVYDIAIAPTKAGEFTVKVGLKDTQAPEHLIKGVPFVVKLEPPVEKPKPIAADDIVVDLSELGAPNEDGVVQFFIKPKKDTDIKLAKFHVAMVGPGDKVVEVAVTPSPDGFFVVALSPIESGEYRVNIDFTDPSGVRSELPPISTHIFVKPVEEPIPEDMLLAASKTKVDLTGLANGLDEQGNLHFSILPQDLPDGVKVVPKLTYVSQAADIPTHVGPHTATSIGVDFHPPSSGEYELEVHLEKDGKTAKLTDTPVKFKVVLPEKAPAEESVQQAAEETVVDFSGLSAEPTDDGGVSFNVNGGRRLPDGARYVSKIIYVPEYSIVPATIINEGDEGNFRVVFYPKHTEGPAEYLVALSILDKNGNEAKVRGGPYRVIVNIVRSAEFPNVNPRVAKVAKEASVDMKPLNSGPNAEGKLHFDILGLPVSLPKASHIEAKITNTADGSDVPAELKPSDGSYSVFFKPAGSGVYLIEVVLVDDEDNGANIKGAPVRLTLNLGTAPPRSANAPDPLVEKAAEGSKVDLSSIGKGINKDGDLDFVIDIPEIPEGAHLESTVVFVPDNLDLPSTITPSPTEKGKYSVAFKPVRTGEYMIATNLVDKDGKSARLKGTPVKLMLTLPEYSSNVTANALPVRSTSNQKVRDAADNSQVDLAPIKEGLNEAGHARFYVDTKDIPLDAVLAPKVAFNNHDLPVTVRPVDGKEGKYSVEFPPSGSGEYLISANILDKDGLPAKVKGTPIRLNLKLPESQSLSVSGSRPRAPTPVVHPPSPQLSSTIPLSFSTGPSTPLSSPRTSSSTVHVPTAQRPSPTLAQSVPSPRAHSMTVAGSLESSNGDGDGDAHKDPALVETRPRSGSTFAYLSAPGGSQSRAQQAVGVEDDTPTSSAHTYMWKQSFLIEAHTEKGYPRLKGGDQFDVTITGPLGKVEGITVEDLGTGKYLVSYVIPGHGKYYVRATINGKDIVGSPVEQNFMKH